MTRQINDQTHTPTLSSLVPDKPLQVVWIFNTLARLFERGHLGPRQRCLHWHKTPTNAHRHQPSNGLVVAPLLDLSQDGRQRGGRGSPIGRRRRAEAVLGWRRGANWCCAAKTPAGLALSARHDADSVRGRSKACGEQRCAASAVKLKRERRGLSLLLCQMSRPHHSSTAGATAQAAPGAVCTLVGPTAASFCRRKAGWGGVHHATNILGRAGLRKLTLFGGSSESWGPHTTPQAVLRAPRQVQQPCRRGARPSANSASLLYPSAFGRPRRWRRG